MAVRIQLRRDTAANWVSSNPVLRAGELGIETDTLKFKIGNGSAWNSITSYANVVPSDLNTTLGDYVTVNDIGAQGGVVGLNNSYNAIIPGSSIILEGPTADSYETTLTVTDPTADRTITLPNADGTLALTTDITSAVDAITTDVIEEGSTNKYFTDERAQDAVSTALAAGTHTNITVTYNDNANSISLAAAPGYVDEQAVDAVAAALAAGTHTNITVTYSDETNAISLTGATTYSDENAQDAVGNILTGGLTYSDSTPGIGINYVTLGDTLLDGVSGASYGLIGTSTYLDVKNTNGYNKEIELDIAAVESKLVTDGFAKLNNPTFTGTVTLPGNPSTANEAATKSYVDNISAGLNFHAAVHAATTADLSATYDNSAKTLSASGAFPQIDGHTVNETERVLVKSQTNAVQNGIYTLTDDGDPSGTWVLTRAADADNTPSGEMAYGDFTFVQNGTTNGGQGYIMTTTGTITLGTSNIVYTQFNTGQSVTAGNGLSEPTAGTLAIDTAITADLSTAQTLTNKTITGTFTGNLTGNADTVTNGVYTNAANTITAASASTKPLILKGAASQSANLLEFHNSSGTPLTFFNSSGGITATEGVISTTYSGGKLTTGTLGYLNATTFNASVSPVIVRGAVSQSANLTEWQDSSGTVLSRIGNTGVNVSAAFLTTGSAASGTNIASQFGTTSATRVPVVIKGAASQSANYFEIQNSGGTALVELNSSNQFNVNYGSIYAPYGLRAGANNHIGLASVSAWATNAAYLALGVRGYSGQTANLTEWQNSSGTVLAKIDSAGIGTFAQASFASGAASIDGGGGLTAGAIYTGALKGSPTAYNFFSNTSGSPYATVVVKGLSGQSTGLQEWQNSSGTVLASVNASGQFVGDGSQLTGLTTALTTPSTVTLTANTATTVDTTALSAFTSLEYMVSIKQGSKVRTSKLVVQTDGTSVDMTEFAITETGGTISGVVVSAAVSGTDAVLQATVTDAATTNATVKLAKIKL